jgi:hypothetical protein
VSQSLALFEKLLNNKVQNLISSVKFPRTKHAYTGSLTFYMEAFTKELKAFYGDELW